MSENEQDIDPTLPNVVKDFLKSGGELQEIRLDGRGNWTHEGLQFENPRIIDLFSRSVGRTEGGTWVLEVGRFTYPITVDDCGFFVERVYWAQSPPVLELSDGTRETLDVETLEYEPGGRLYCRVKDGEFRARFKHNAYHSLTEHLRREDDQLVIEIDGIRKVLGDVDELYERESS